MEEDSVVPTSTITNHVNISTIKKERSTRNREMVVLPPTILAGATYNQMEVSIHQCSKLLLRELAQVFPCLNSVSPSHDKNSMLSPSNDRTTVAIRNSDNSTTVQDTNINNDSTESNTAKTMENDNQMIKIVDRQDVLAIPTIQKSVMDIVQIGPEIEKEKDRCLEVFVEFASTMCKEIDRHGYWADYIDPCSGLPMLNKERAHHYNEVDGFQHLLRYQTQNAGCCKILLHPRYGSSCYPATLFTVAPKELVLRIFQEKFLLL